MKIKADFHNHLSTLENFSKGFNKAMDIAKKNLGKEGMFAIINTQSKSNGRYEKFLELDGYDRGISDNYFYVPEKDIYVIKGQEVSTQGGHVLILGLNKGTMFKDGRSLEDSLKEAKDRNGIIIACHPFFLDGIFKKEDYEKYLDYIDAIEIHNGESWIPIPGHINSNKKAREFYDKAKKFYDIGAISTSDGHSINEIGTSYSMIDQPYFSINPIKLIESLRKSLRQHKSWEKDKQTNSYFGALDHAGKMTGLILASKSGLIGKI